MGVHRQGAVVTWPTFALLVDREHSRGTGADLAFRVDGHDAMATLASHMDMQLSTEGHGRVRLLLAQAHALRPLHLEGELVVHDCCSTSREDEDVECTFVRPRIRTIHSTLIDCKSPVSHAHSHADGPTATKWSQSRSGCLLTERRCTSRLHLDDGPFCTLELLPPPTGPWYSACARHRRTRSAG